LVDGGVKHGEDTRDENGAEMYALC